MAKNRCILYKLSVLWKIIIPQVLEYRNNYFIIGDKNVITHVMEMRRFNYEYKPKHVFQIYKTF